MLIADFIIKLDIEDSVYQEKESETNYYMLHLMYSTLHSVVLKQRGITDLE